MLLLPYLFGAGLIMVGALFMLVWLAAPRWETLFVCVGMAGFGAFIIWAYNTFGPIPFAN